MKEIIALKLKLNHVAKKKYAKFSMRLKNKNLVFTSKNVQK